MAHYAYVNEDNIVTQVIVGKNEDEGGVDWEAYYGAVRTSYNTRGNQHATGGTPFRYNYATIGGHFDPNFGADGAFIDPQPYPSWTLNSETALWESPVPYPNDGGMYVWDEATTSWLVSAI